MFSFFGSVYMNLTSNFYFFVSFFLSVGRGSGVAMNCGVDCRCVTEPALLWLWRWLAAVAPVVPLAWETPYATGAALKSKAKKKKSK